MTNPEPLVITIPAFVDEVVARAGTPGDDAAWMRLAIALSVENVERGGAPFGAVVALTIHSGSPEGDAMPAGDRRPGHHHPRGVRRLVD